MTTDAAQLIADVCRQAVARRYQQRASASDGIAVWTFRNDAGVGRSWRFGPLLAAGPCAEPDSQQARDEGHSGQGRGGAATRAVAHQAKKLPAFPEAATFAVA